MLRHTSHVAVELLLDDIRKLEVDTPGFFGRRDELTSLVKILSQKPLAISILVGPKDAGKTRILSHLRVLWNRTIARKVLTPLLIINMKVRDCSTPEAFAQVLREELEGWLTMAQAAINDVMHAVASSLMGIRTEDISSSLKSFQDQLDGSKTALASMQDIIARFLSHYPMIKPIIVIDGANFLTDWEQSYGRELCRFLAFLEGLTKEQARAHVIMASSDESYRSWLQEKLTSGKVETMGIGYFSEDEAKEYFSDFCIPGSGIILPTEWETTVWPTVYNAAGGSPLLLQSIVDSAAEHSDPGLINAADTHIMMEELYLQEVDGDKRWSRDEFKGIIKAILDHGGVVHKDAVVQSVFNGDSLKGDTVFKELVKDNLLHVRVVLEGWPYKDINVTRGGEYLMAATPCSLAAMKKLNI